MADRYNVAITPKIEERFWAKVECLGPDECWLWRGALNSSGYGSFGIDGLVFHASQVTLMIDGQPRPPSPNDHALHSCDNPACVNPKHLRWGTQQENIAERDQRRGKYRRPGNLAHAKLTEKQVIYVLQSQKPGWAVARELGVHKATISDIRCGKTWLGVRERAFVEGDPIRRLST